MKSLRPLLFFAAVLMLVGLACSALTGGGDTPEAPVVTQEPVQQPVNNPPTTAPEPTAVPPTEEQPTDEPPQPVSARFFTEEFDQDPGDSWVVDIIGPGAEEFKDTAKQEFDNSRMRVELPKDDLYFYYSYVGDTYDNVRIDLRADNRGVNTNNVSLFCRSSSDGWYEWGVGSGGDWYLYAVTDKFNLLANGGTNFVKQGKEVNEYTMICKDQKISMFVNGKEIKQSPVTDKKYGLRDGTVGFNISSLNVTPVIVEVDWFKVSEP